MEQELMQLKAEIYDANKTINNLNLILSEIAKIAGVKEGASLDSMYTRIRNAFPKSIDVKEEVKEARI